MTTQELAPSLSVPSDYFTESEAACLLGIKPTLLARLRRRGAIAHLRFSPRCVRYTPAQIATYHAQCERPQVTEEGRPR